MAGAGMRFCDAARDQQMLIRRAHHTHFQIGVAQLFVKIRREIIRGHAAPAAYFVTF
jgi:hypothetical protein